VIAGAPGAPEVVPVKPSLLAVCALVAQALPSLVYAQLPAEVGGAGASPQPKIQADISAIASFSAAYDSYDVEQQSPERGELFGRKGQPTFIFQEVELGLQAVVDPYLRGDVFIAFTPEEVDVEEAYATTLGLPAGLQLKVGKFFSPFGRLNQQHPHAWEFVDAPLAMGRLLATEKLGGPGVAASWLAPLPWFVQVELAGQSTAPYDGMSPEFTGAGRLLQYVELTGTDSLGVGVSAARRNEGRPGAFRDLAGADLHWRHRDPGSRSSFTVQAEYYLRKLRGVPAPEGEGGISSEKPDRAFWAQGVYRQNAWVAYGLRYEEAPATGSPAPGTERRAAAVLDWYPSEFSRVALQGSYDRRPGGGDGLEALLHFEFILGAHGAHPF
jgi:hypothetical protein